MVSPPLVSGSLISPHPFCGTAKCSLQASVKDGFCYRFTLSKNTRLAVFRLFYFVTSDTSGYCSQHLHFQWNGLFWRHKALESVTVNFGSVAMAKSTSDMSHYQLLKEADRDHLTCQKMYLFLRLCAADTGFFLRLIFNWYCLHPFPRTGILFSSFLSGNKLILSLL